MMLFVLNKNTFFRKLENIGYLYNQSSGNDLIVDNVGAEFLSKLNRSPISLDSLSNDLSSLFPDVAKLDLENDLIELFTQLEKDEFLICGINENDIYRKEKLLLENINNKVLLTNNDCKNIYDDSEDYLINHFKRYPRLFKIHIELTTRCNLNCIHCYLPSEIRTTQLPKEMILDILDQLQILGTLEITFSGGEPFLHKEFIEILSYARSKDFSVRIMTNASLINDDIINKLSKLNLARIQISLYSMDPTVHDLITGAKGSWEKTKLNIDKLIKNNIRVEIACPILKENQTSFEKLIEYYENKGVYVANDLAISARTDFSRDNLTHRLDLSEIKNVIQELINSKPSYKNSLLDKTIKLKKRNADYPVCGFGLNQICLSGNGDYYPCPGFKLILGNAYKDTIQAVWFNSPLIEEIRKLTNASYQKCMQCDSLDYCTICPANYYNESKGNYLEINEYFCEIAKANKELVNNMKR